MQPTEIDASTSAARGLAKVLKEIGQLKHEVL
jgi:hypothetical protein